MYVGCPLSDFPSLFFTFMDSSTLINIRDDASIVTHDSSKREEAHKQFGFLLRRYTIQMTLIAPQHIPRQIPKTLVRNCVFFSRGEPPP